MADYSNSFKDFDGNIWLNCAHQGPMPKATVEELNEALEWKLSPYHLTSDRFREVPSKMKSAIGKLINIPPEEIILTNGASYGIHLLANGIPWKSGDEVLLMQGDFPSDILPWLALKKKGVTIRFIEPKEHVLSAEELIENISPSSKLLCITWVHSLSGYTIDIAKLGEICKEKGIIFVVNASQALGVRALNISNIHIDALVSVGFKWLCGPYGTGFCWIRSEILESLEYNQAYWLAMMTADDLGKKQDILEFPQNLGAKKYDIFCTANFFNFKPWQASVKFLLEIGIEAIEKHNNLLISQFIEGLDNTKYDLISANEGKRRSSLIFISHIQPEINENVYDILKKNNIHISFRGGRLRISPHLYNTIKEIEITLDLLNSI